MKLAKYLTQAGLITILIVLTTKTIWAGDGLTITAGADLVSRYIWRGLMINDAPNVQPAMTLATGGLECGVWGSSTLANSNADDDTYPFAHEVDFWAGYTHQFDSGLSVGGVVTDYYFPNAGVELGNFNDYDDDEGAGAHTVELGLTFGGPDSFPIGLSAYANVHNDEGQNAYFQLDYSTVLDDINFSSFVGAAGGSKKNPDYYGAEDFQIINLGFTAVKSIFLTEQYSLPVSVSFIMNPNTEVCHLVMGISL